MFTDISPDVTKLNDPPKLQKILPYILYLAVNSCHYVQTHSVFAYDIMP